MPDDPFKAEEGRLLLVERCYVCDERCGCCLLSPPDHRVAIFKAQCLEGPCARYEKPDCLVKIQSNQAPMPVLCKSCALKTGG